MINTMVSIDNLIEIVKAGGKIKTGVDVYNAKGILLLDKKILVDKVKTLELIKENGVKSVPVNSDSAGGIWGANGNQIKADSHGFVDLGAFGEGMSPKMVSNPVGHVAENMEQRLLEIEEIKEQAAVQFARSKECIKTAVAQIKESQGEFDVKTVESHVKELTNFLTTTGHPFSYLDREIFSHEDYLYNHSINVCAIGTAVTHQFNSHFSNMVEGFLSENTADIPGRNARENELFQGSFQYYYKDELDDISLGFFLYDIGKVLLPESLVNKNGKLTPREFDMVKLHSHGLGVEILEKNNIQNAMVKNIVAYHHAELFDQEPGCYPRDKKSLDIPLYVKICKLADMYDAMTSKRSYQEALNQISAVTEIFRKYVKKDTMLQFILRAFVKSVGIYPPGSIVYLANGQMAYVLESRGPFVLPFTDIQGNTLTHKPAPVDLGSTGMDPGHRINKDRSIKMPKDVYSLLPEYLRKITLSV